MYVCMVITYYSKSMDQPGKVANPARGQLNMENEYFPVSPFAPENYECTTVCCSRCLRLRREAMQADRYLVSRHKIKQLRDTLNNPT